MSNKSARKVPGSVIERKGRFTAMGYVRDPVTGKVSRPSFGTFETEVEAWQALGRAFYGVSTTASAPAVVAPRSTPSAPVSSKRLDAYYRDYIIRRERSGRLERRTISDIKSTWRLYILPCLGHVCLGDLTSDMVVAMLDAMRLGTPYNKFNPPRPLSPRVQTKALNHLHRALRDARLPVNPAQLPSDERPMKAKPDLSDGNEGAWPTVEETDIFLAHIRECDGQYGRRLIGLWSVAVTTGARRAELCGLSWPDYHDPPVIEIRRTLQSDNGLFLKGPKSRLGTRPVGLPPSAVVALEAQRAQQQREQIITGRRWEARPFGHDLMFRDPWGGAINPDSLSMAFQREWQHAGLRPGVTLHGLRHGHISKLIELGWTLDAIARRVGATIAVIESFYRHQLNKRRAAERDSSALESIYK